MYKIAFHIHSSYSFDSFSNPIKIVKFAVGNNIDCLVITDHDSTKGSLIAQDYVKKNSIDIDIPISAEYLTDIGDIIAVNIPYDFEKIYKHQILCKVAKELNGTIILPHPYKGHNIDKIDYSNIDYIEIFNSRCSIEENYKAILLAKKLKKKIIYGSDAHFLMDIGNVLSTNNDSKFLNDTFYPLKLSYTVKNRIVLSQFIKAYKYRDIILFKKCLINFIKYNLYKIKGKLI